MLCIKCNKKKIHIQKRKLCESCYHKARRKRELLPLSKKSKRAIKKTLSKKYGSKIITDFNNLNKKQFWNLSNISKKFGFTRERARQIYIILYDAPYSPTMIAKTKKRNDYMGCTNDPRYKVAEYKKGNNPVWKSAKTEKMFFDECNKKKINTEFPCKKEIDIKSNGYFVDIKSAFSPKHFSPNNKIKYFHFGISKIQKNNCDFLACYHGKEKKFFIIPKKEFKNVTSIYISETPSTYHNAKNRYWEYKDAWHLLK